MYYEVYIDSLFLLNFTMNLYLLLLVNVNLNRPATRLQIFIGALLAGAGYCMMVLIPFPFVVLKILTTAVLVNSIILIRVFRPGSIKAFVRIWEKMMLYSFLMGGALFMLENLMQPFPLIGSTVMGLLAGGGMMWLFFFYETAKKQKAEAQLCKAQLFGKNGARVEVWAIVDTGNCLREPISGKPVSVLEQDILKQLFFDEETGFRAIPYHSVGCDRGIMKGYEVPKLIVEQEGIRKTCCNVYVGVSKTAISKNAGYQMLIHPALFEK